MSHVIKEITNWFEAQKGQILMIEKRELSIGLQQISDLDQLELSLDKIEINANEESQVDDYIAPQELSLYGHGTVVSDGREAKLPQNVFKIPLTHNITTRKVENGLQINTERAEYSFYPH
jgi:hypothetical protein